MSSPSLVPMVSPDGQHGDVPASRVEDAVKAGFTMGVDMISPDGRAGVVPLPQVGRAARAGFKPGPDAGVEINDAGNAVITPRKGEDFQDTIRRAVAYGRSVTTDQVSAEMKTAPQKSAEALGAAAGVGVAGPAALAATEPLQYGAGYAYETAKDLAASPTVRAAAKYGLKYVAPQVPTYLALWHLLGGK